jgi:hypothetical protein
LIGNDFEFIAVVSKPQDGFEEIGAFGSIALAGAEN